MIIMIIDVMFVSCCDIRIQNFNLSSALGTCRGPVVQANKSAATGW